MTQESQLTIPQLGGQKQYPTAKKKKSALTPSQIEKIKGEMKDELEGKQSGDDVQLPSSVQELFDSIAADMDAVDDGFTPIAELVLPSELPVNADDMPKPDGTLVRILQWKRPHNSTGEQNFVKWLCDEILARGAKFEISSGGNVLVMMPYNPAKTNNAKGKVVIPTIIFSCHTDTVHSNCNGDQVVMFDPNMGHVFLDTKSPSAGSCLGADDGAGIWLMLEMIRAKVPGSYLFHRGEEVGGVGSRAMLVENAPWLRQHDIALAFDRKDTCDVVIRQGGLLCASEKFGAALSKALNDGTGFNYKISHGGTFTDTKVYRGEIAECVNISVGYENAHSSQEYLDYHHLNKLRDQLIALEWDKLPVDRDPTTAEQSTYTYHKPKTELPRMPVSDFSKAKPKAVVITAKESAVISARSEQEPPILDEMRTLTLDDMRELSEDAEGAMSVILTLYLELDAAYRKIGTYRDLLDLT